MSRLIVLFCLAAFQMWNFPVLTSAQSDPQWKFQADQTFYLLETSDLKQGIQIRDQTRTQKAKQTLLVEVKVQEMTPENHVTLELTIETLRAKGNTLSDNILMDRIEGSTFTMTLDNQRKITKFLGYDELIKRVSSGDEALELMFRRVLTQDRLKQSLSRPFLLFSSPIDNSQNPKATGTQKAGWKVASKMPLGLFGTLTLNQTLTPDGTEKKNQQTFSKYKLTGTVKFQKLKPTEQNVPFLVEEGELSESQLTGSLLFDAEKGQLVTQKSQLDLKATLKVKLGDHSETMNLKITQENQVEITNEKPLLEDGD